MKIGPYELVRELGRGGMAQVFLAKKEWPDGSRRSCVVKCPDSSASIDELKLRQFLEEARLSMKMEHDNIVTVFDTGVHEKLPYIVMSYIAGRNLAVVSEAVARTDAWDVEIAVHIVREIAFALSYAHDFSIEDVPQKVVHRDVASKNVMISGTGGVLLMDFGVATSLETRSSGIHIKGTLPYMAPEHYLGKADQRSDVFGLGGIFWELLAGRPFRDGLQGPALIEAVVSGVMQPLARRVPSDVLRVLEGMLEPQAANRIRLRDVLLSLKNYPNQRLAIAALMAQYFGSNVRASGHSAAHFAAPKELMNTMAVVQAGGLSLSQLRDRRAPGEVRKIPANFQPVRVDDTANTDPPEAKVRETGGADGQDAEADTRGAQIAHEAELPSARGNTVSLPRPAGFAGAGAVAEELPPTVWLSSPVEGTSENAQIPTTERSVPIPVPSQRSPQLSVAAQPMPSPRPGSAPPPTTERSVPIPVQVEQSPQLSGAAPPMPRRHARTQMAPSSAKTRRWIPALLLALGGVLVGMMIVLWAESDEVTPELARARGAQPAEVAKEIPKPSPPAPIVVHEVVVASLETSTGMEFPDDSGTTGGAAEALDSDDVGDAMASTSGDPLPAPIPSSKPKKVKKRPVRKVSLVVRRGFVDYAQIKIGSKVYEVPARGSLDIEIKVGTYRVAWRTEPGGAWQSLRHSFSPTMRYHGRLEPSGLSMRSSPLPAGAKP